MRWFAILVLLATPAFADDEQPPLKTPFDRGKLSLGLAGGTTSSLGYRYYLIGAGLGYFVLDGVELGAGGLVEFGDGPSIAKVTPSLRYIAQPLVGKWPVIPYVGAFYNPWF